MPFVIPSFLFTYEKKWIRGALNRKRELKSRQPKDGIAAYVWSGLRAVRPDKELLPEGVTLQRRRHLDLLIDRINSNYGEPS